MSKGRAAQLVEAGLWLRLSGDHEGAKRLFEQALKLDPENNRARQLLDAPPATGLDHEVRSPGSSPAMDLDWGNQTGLPPEPEPGVTEQIRIPAGGEYDPDGPNGPNGPNGQNEQDITIETESVGDDRLPPPVNDVEIDLPIEGDVSLDDGFSVPVESPTAPEPWTDLVPPAMPPVRPLPPTVSPFDLPPPPAGNTLVYAGAEGQGQQGQQPSTTMVYAGTNTQPVAPPQVPPGMIPLFQPQPPSGTLVFGGQNPGAPQSGQPVPGAGGSTLVMMSSPNAAGTPQFGRTESSTMVFSQPVAPPLSPHPSPGMPPGLEDAFPFSSQTLTGLPRTGGPIPPPPITSPGPQSSQRDPFAGIGIDIDINSGPIEMPHPPLAPGASPNLAPGAKSAWDRQSNPGIELATAAPELSNVLDLVKSIEPRSTFPKAASPEDAAKEVHALLSGARDLLELDDHSGAMELIVKAQELAPDNQDVRTMRERSERTLEAMFESKLGDLNAKPRVKLKDDEIIWLNLDHRAGFVLAQIDSTVSFEDVFAVSGMSRVDTARILAQLLEEGVIARS